jgi:hypothetical protein
MNNTIPTHSNVRRVDWGRFVFLLVLVVVGLCFLGWAVMLSFAPTPLDSGPPCS